MYHSRVLKLVLKMMLAAFVMMLGFGMLIVGVLMLAGVTPTHMAQVAIPLVVVGPVIGVASFLKLLQLNRQHGIDMWQATVDKPELVFAHWTDRDGRDVLFAINGLFVDKRYYAFAEAGSHLNSIGFEDDVLKVVVHHLTGRDYVNKQVKVEVPATQRDAVAHGVRELQEALGGLGGGA